MNTIIEFFTMIVIWLAMIYGVYVVFKILGYKDE